jgi:diguanylate cyclase (GGDEF)-like protein
MVAVLFLDLDDFKGVNDRHGNACADRVLVEVASRTRALVRGDDVVGRVGSDEFVVLCEDMKGVSEAVALARRLLRRVEQPIALDEGTGFGGALASFTVSGSIGIACTLAAIDTPDELLRRASDAMYAAKRAGRNRVEVADP